MEALAMGESKKLEAKLASAAAYVEGGIQEACDDACSICLEEFCDSDPSTVTGCKHEFHLQCILEWCQRSSQCPMCWQSIGLKDPASQELLDAVVQERNLRLNPPRNAAIFHHPSLGNFEIQHLPVGVNDTELEERIIQHLAAAAAMGRARHFSRREGQQRNRSSNHGRPQFLVFSTQPNAHAGQASPARGESELHTSISGPSPSSPLMMVEQSVVTPANQSVQPDMVSSPGSRAQANQHSGPLSRGSPYQAPSNQDRAGPSDLQSFTEALKSRLNTMSMRYKESISKSTRGWKEKWFPRNSPTADHGSQANRREVDAVIPTENSSSLDSAPSGSGVTAVLVSNEEQESDTGINTESSQPGRNHSRETCIQTPFAASSGSS